MGVGAYSTTVFVMFVLVDREQQLELLHRSSVLVLVHVLLIY